MTDAANVEIAKAILNAYVAKDRAAAERLIGDDFHFTSPLDNRIDREAYFAICWPNSETTEAFDIISAIPDGDRVIITYVGRSTGGKRFRNTEILTVRDEAIVNIEVYFGWSIPHKAPAGGHIDPS